MAPIALAAGIVAVVFAWAASWTGPERGSALLDALHVLLTALPWTLLWLAAAAGLGVAARVTMRRWIEIDGVQQLAVGIALLLALDAALGALGVLQVGGSLGAWCFTIAAIVPLVVALLRMRQRPVHLHAAAPWMYAAAGPAVAVLVLAAASAPGWLWATEFGGYDVLSYHLQLPREWFEAGRITPVEHNVYSFLPGFMEAAYYHIMVVHGDPHGAIVACQLLHAGMAVITALACARVARRLLHDAAGDEISAFAWAIVLGTPWIVVVGSLAYNELPGALALAGGLSIIIERRGAPPGRAAIIGLLVAAAIGAKLTAVGFVALPLVVVGLWYEPKRITALIAIGCASALFISPWLIRNALHNGNPVFPFLPEIFGSAHFTEQQMATWQAGHQPDLSFGQRLGEAFEQLFRYGLGANPDPTGHEPWSPQWSILPWLSLAGCALGTTAPRLRRPAMVMLLIIALQFAFWILFTHIKSRFMVAMVVPASIAATIGMLRVLQLLHFSPDGSWRIGRVILIGAAAAYCIQPLLLFRVQEDGAAAAQIGMVGVRTGRDVPDDQLSAYAEALPEVFINRVLPEDARILLVGDAAPLYYTADVTYCTVWDRGPMSEIIAQHPDQPARWFDELRARGFTHLLIEPLMLEVWQRSGWRDPLLDPDALLSAAERHAELLARYPNGTVLHELIEP